MTLALVLASACSASGRGQTPCHRVDSLSDKDFTVSQCALDSQGGIPNNRTMEDIYYTTSVASKAAVVDSIQVVPHCGSTMIKLDCKPFCEGRVPNTGTAYAVKLTVRGPKDGHRWSAVLNTTFCVQHDLDTAPWKFGDVLDLSLHERRKNNPTIPQLFTEGTCYLIQKSEGSRDQ